MANLLSQGTGYAGLFGPDAILSASGAPIVSTPVTVYQSDGSTAATLYTDQTKAAGATNPVATDSYGNLAFYTNPGLYILSFTVGGVTTTKTVLIDPWYTDAAWNVIVDTTSQSPLSGDARLGNAALAALTYTLPSPSIGARLRMTKIDTTANLVTVTSGSGSILGLGCGSGVTSIALWRPGDFIEVMGDGSNWHAVSMSIIPGTILASVQLFATGYTTTNTGGAPIDGSNFITPAFIAPPSGLVRVTFSVLQQLTLSGTGYLFYTTNLPGAAAYVASLDPTSGFGFAVTYDSQVTLTPNTSYQCAPSWGVNNGANTGTINAGNLMTCFVTAR